MDWHTDFSPETVQSDLRSDAYVLGVRSLERKLTYAVEAYVNNRRSWLSAPRSSWRGSREESYEIAIGYALQYQRAVLADLGAAQAKTALSGPMGWQYFALMYLIRLPHMPEGEWEMAVGRVRRDARLRFGAELRAAELSPRGEARH